MTVYGVWVINKAGGLIFQRNYGAGIAQQSSNEYLVMAGTLHGVHAITSRIAPVPKSSGVQTIESESFKMTIHMTLTGIKFVLISSVDMANAESVLQRIYEAYADAVMKNPFYTPEMPINATGFDAKINAIVAAVGP
ncbi:hypothetical protein NliqN6_0304 [Naganishia liquefaciens]|uniref:Trafficking protein particle complex subunit n=1 Tax=Naganishia liquefaciens TaxID=104408 RepID=A0A8H3TMQ4_9TREE|nr:hypothetical protein NliqN6_0304 [Naganishia liquefaciens]